jgi:hypothetical protein
MSLWTSASASPASMLIAIFVWRFAPPHDNNITLISFTYRHLIKMAEEEGFEPPRALTPLSVFKTDPFSQAWVFLRDK